MSNTAVAVREAFPVVLPGVHGVPWAGARLEAGEPGPWKRLLFWPAEFLRLVGLVYLFPIVILAIGIPLALALNGLLRAGSWLWQLLG
jgi:hypothetical protein